MIVGAGLMGILGTDHATAAAPRGQVTTWGRSSFFVNHVPQGLDRVISIVTGPRHAVALKLDGTVVAWGTGAYTVPQHLSGVVAVSAGVDFSVALKGDGTVTAWGGSASDKTKVPEGLSSVTAISAGGAHTLALKSDGTVVAWGLNDQGQSTVPPGLSDVVAIATSDSTSMALKANGTVVAWGGSVPQWTQPPSDLRGVVKIAAKNGYFAAIKDDGKVVVWGQAYSGLANVPAGLINVKEVALGWYNIAALKYDGTVVVWGANNYDLLNPPPGLSGVTQITIGNYHISALKSDGTVVAWGSDFWDQTSVPAFLDNVTAIAAAGDTTLALVGSAYPKPEIAVEQPAGTDMADGTSRDFGIVYTGASKTLSFTIKNRDEGALTGLTATLDGANSSDFEIITSPTAPVGMGGSTSMEVRFSPTAAGARTAVLHIASNDEDESSFDITLTGTGTTGLLALSSASYTVSQDTPELQVTITRSGPPVALAVILSSADGPAQGNPPFAEARAGSDYTALNKTLSFAEGEMSKTATLQLLPKTKTGLPNKRLTLNLSAPTNGSLLATPSSAEVRILAHEVAKPSLTVTTPGTGKTLSAASPYLVTGTAGDARGIDRVEVVLNGSTVPLEASLNMEGSNTKVSWSIAIDPVPGTNTLEITAYDLRGNASTTVRRTFAYVRRHRLTLERTRPIGEVFSLGPAPISLPVGLSGVKAVATGRSHALTLMEDGSVRAFGSNTGGQATVPPGLGNVIAIAAGDDHSVALESDGTVVEWGGNSTFRGTAPAFLSKVVAVAAGAYETVVLKENGTVVSWGDFFYFPPPAGLTGVVAISAGNKFNLALKADGTVVGWGYHVQTGSLAVPANLTGVTAIAAGEEHALALKSDGTVVAWGDSWFGRTKVPAGLKDVVAIAAGDYHSVALKADGTVVGWGYSLNPLALIGLRGVTAISAGDAYTLALQGDSSASPPQSLGKITLSALPAAQASALIPSSASADPRMSEILPGTAVQLVASPQPGYFFSHWTGLPASSVTLGSKTSFSMPAADLKVSAVFIRHPFIFYPGQGTTFQGIVLPENESDNSVDSTGFITGTMSAASGTLSGKILISGRTEPFTAIFFGDGSCLFKKGSLLTPVLALAAGHNLSLSIPSFPDTINATLTRSGITSRATLYRSVASSQWTVSSSLLPPAGGSGLYTLTLPAKTQTPERDRATYPQGSGYASMTLAKTGVVSIVGRLADGTAFTSGSVLHGYTAYLFSQLITPGGAASQLGGTLGGTLNLNYDYYMEWSARVESSPLLWTRPAVTQLGGTKSPATATQPYTDGWPSGIRTDVSGTLYNKAVSIQSALNLDDSTTANATLSFTDGKLVSFVTIDALNITKNAVRKIPATNSAFTLTINAATGFFSGTFTPDWDQPSPTKPVFQGILIQKSGGSGFFMSNRVNDLDPESGVVTF